MSLVSEAARNKARSVYPLANHDAVEADIERQALSGNVSSPDGLFLAWCRTAHERLRGAQREASFASPQAPQEPDFDPAGTPSTATYTDLRQWIIAGVRDSAWPPKLAAEILRSNLSDFPEIDYREIEALEQADNDWVKASDLIARAFPSGPRLALQRRIAWKQSRAQEAR